VLTSVEYDHPDFFTEEAQMLDSFRHFVSLAPVPQQTAIYACADQPRAVEIAQSGPQPVKGSYGFSSSADFRAEAVEYQPKATEFLVTVPPHTGDTARRPLGRVRLAVPGQHNVQNALGALAAVIGGLRADIAFDKAAAALASFRGTGRRFEMMGETPDGVIVIDDYAHHPTAIKAILQAARLHYPDRCLWAVWQPHTFSRTVSLLNDYAAAFDAADHVVVTDVYAAREVPPEGTTVTAFTGQVVRSLRHPHVHHTPTLEDAVRVLLAETPNSAIIVIMSAGDAPLVGRDFLRRRGQG
jgi:UDP-N-acetylmuramate--alanine ligase